MSGGSWDYFYQRLEDIALRLIREDCHYRRALGAQLSMAAMALHAIEWVDSCDFAKGEDIEPIKKALGESCEQLAYEELKKEALDLIDRLNKFKEAINI